MTIRLTSYRIALIQMASHFLNREANLNKAEGSIRKAAANGAKLICLPESFDLGYDGTRLPEMMAFAQTENGPAITRMCTLAKELHVFILAPVFRKTSAGQTENSAFLMDDEGVLLGTYSKTHPVGDERVYLNRGTEYPVFDTKLGKLGIAICYDACFPETARILAAKGSEVLLVPAAWRGSHYYKDWWNLSLRSRALDNLMYVAAVNMTGPTGNEFFAGKSQLCSPIGECLCECGVDEERILYGEIDLNRIAREREFNTVLTDRHPEDYTILCQAVDSRGIIHGSI